MIPSPGRIVMYRLTMRDAAHVNRRRADSSRSMTGVQHSGAVLHTGNQVQHGDIFPMMIVRVWDTKPDRMSAVQGQVFLDGNDTLWVESVMQEGETLDPRVQEGVWFQPPTAS